MLRKCLRIGVLSVLARTKAPAMAAALALGCCAGNAAFGATTPSGARAAPEVSKELTAEQIVDRNVAARGGLDAWRKIQTLVWAGHLESPDSPDPRLPFVLEQRRPNKTHFEINTMGQKSMRVFDGTHGWRARPGKGSAPDVKPFTPQELKFAREAQGIDGPLIDYQAKGNTVALVGIEDIEGRKNYRIAVHLASGETQDVWIDANTFLDTRYDRTTYSATGQRGIVSVFYRDYKVVEGLAIPAIMEIGVGSARVPDKMVVEKVALNPPLDDKVFSRPGGMPRRGVSFVNIEPAPGMIEYPRTMAPPRAIQAPAAAASTPGPATNPAQQ